MDATTFLCFLLSPFLTLNNAQVQFEMLDALHFVKGKYEDFNSKIMDLQAQYCLQYCMDRFKFIVNLSPRNEKCAPCFCDEQCYQFNDCCPDKVLFDKVPTPVKPWTQYGCHALTMGKHLDTYGRIIDKCVDDYTDQEVKNDCFKSDSLHWKYVKPYYDYVSGLSYKNKYCAICNHVTTLQSYQVNIECKSFEDYGTSSNATEIYFHVLNNNRCSITFDPPAAKQSDLRHCVPTQEPFYTKCNQTGTWSFYNDNINRACELYTNVVLGKYKNIFCRLCNEDMTWMQLKQEPEGHVTFGQFSMTSLLDLGDDSVIIQRHRAHSDVVIPSTSPCADDELLNPLSCQCEKLFCSEGEKIENGKCKSLFPESNSFGYDVCARVTGTFNESDFLFPNFTYALQNQDFKYPDYVISIDINPVISCGEGLVNITADVMTRLIFEHPVNTDLKQKELIEKVNQIGSSVSFNGGEVVSTVAQNCPPPNENSVQNFPSGSPCNSPIPPFTRTMPLKQELSKALQSMVFVKFTKLLTCAQILLNSTQVVEESGQLVILHNEIRLSSGEFDKRGDHFMVCKEDFLAGTSTDGCLPDDLTNNRTNGTTGQQTGSTPLGILSVVCTCISLLFLIITFAFYCTVKYMRNVVGVNVMGLIVNLFIAQVVYVFGLELYDYPDLCTAMAILVHYFWLSATFWMNSCTIVLFLKLSFPLHSRAFTTKYILLRSCLYSTLSPLIIVTLTIVINITHHGTIGYGSPVICYITNVQVRRLAFALPLGLLILSNIVLFCYTFIKIRVDQVESAINKENKINIWACLKLSVITGAAWIFAFVYEATGAIAFAYFFTILVGTQGVILFFAFVVNKRVLMACKESVHSKSESSTAASKQKKYLVKTTTDSPLTSLSKSKSSTDSDTERAVKVRPPLPPFGEDAM